MSEPKESQQAIRQVYLETSGRLHSSFRSIITYPPQGYRFFSRDYYDILGIRGIKNRQAIASIAPRVSNVIPLKLARSLLGYFSKPPAGTDLVLTSGLIDFRRERWIVAAEDAINSFLGLRTDIRLYHPVVEKALELDNCKAVIYCFDATKRSLTNTYNLGRARSKLRHLPLAVPLVKEKKRSAKKTVDIVLLGSANFRIPSWFYAKGGHLLVKAFLNLKKEFDNISLTMLNSVPSDYASILKSEPRIFVPGTPVLGEDLNNLLWHMDICALPTIVTPWTAFLDAMNRELPIVTTACHANKEVVQHNETGLIVDVPPELDLIVDNFEIPNRKALTRIDKVWLKDNEPLVRGIADSLRVLIKDELLRRRLGENGRKRLEPGGRFSIETRNLVLKDILDRAMAG
ncbi:MAG: glycosyltransferase family 4 protein [Nitrososphaerota archaeon]|nr:glycosyltransferase family 4 protein [Nitrososphaerota archaeon]